MDDSLSEKMAGLSRLRIERTQRPTGSRRGWLLLAGIVVLVVAGAAGAAYWYYQTTGVNIAAALAEKTFDVNVTVVPTQPSGPSDPVVMVANGKIVSDRLVNVATKVSGQIVELNVEQGDRVEKDQVLARIEDVVYRAQRDEAAARVAQGEHAVAQAKAEAARAQAAIAEATAENDFRQRDFRRIEDLYQRGQASEFEYLNAKNLAEAAAAALEVAQAAAASAVAAVSAAESDVEAARAVGRVWQKRLDDCAIRAPIAGVVLERNAEVGDFLAAEGGRGANANAQLVSIADMTLLRVEVDVSERDIHRVQAGQRARITPDADRAAYAGQVLWVDPVGDYARAIVQVKVRVLDPGPNLRVDGSAKVEFLGAPAASVSGTGATSGPAVRRGQWLPKAVVQLTPGSDDALVFTVENNRAVPHSVRLGTRADKAVEVLSGVQPGMQLICENIGDLKAGTSVRVMRTVPIGDL